MRRLILLLLIASASAQTDPSAYLDSIRSQPSLLLEFLRAMPKGGDLHNHLSGAIYDEDYIQWAAEDKLCINRRLMKFVACADRNDHDTVPATEVLTDSDLYDQVIDAQSMRNFRGPGSGHDHFFDTFEKFDKSEDNRVGDELAVAATQAAADRVSYLELMFTPQGSAADSLAQEHSVKFDRVPTEQQFEDARRKLTEGNAIDAIVAAAQQDVTKAEQRQRELLHCSSQGAQPAACAVRIRFLYQILRGRDPADVFAEMLLGFELAKHDPRFVGLNPVMPEDGYNSMHNFDQLMAMFAYCKKLYPDVHLSLHAGELWTGLVPPEGLCCHIRKSVEIAHADRIGHGVDIMFEDDPAGLLREMAAKKVAVEINLTSNDVILGVRGDEHPFPIYRKFGVPVVISTDDEGVSRSNMTQEYLRAVRDYHLSYADLKQIVRNSLEFSFLAGSSLWADSTYTHTVAACQNDRAPRKPSPKCENLLAHSDRARLQRQLESELALFEARTCCAIPPISAGKSTASVR